MENHKIIHRDELTGYRRPLPFETKRMAEYLCADEKRAKILFMIFFAAFLIFGLLAFASLITNSKSGMIFKIILTVVLLSGSVYFYSVVQKSNKIIQKLQNGDFQVLDCFVYEAELDLNGTNTAVVKIYHSDLYCDDWFTVNTNSMKIWQEDHQYPFTLLRCDYDLLKKAKRYELFSDNKLKERLER